MFLVFLLFQATLALVRDRPGMSETERLSDEHASQKAAVSLTLSLALALSLSLSYAHTHTYTHQSRIHTHLVSEVFHSSFVFVWAKPRDPHSISLCVCVCLCLCLCLCVCLCVCLSDPLTPRSSLLANPFPACLRPSERSG